MSTNNHNNLRDRIYLAALLHDIGKFYQRADEDGASRSKIIKKEIKDLETFICPINSKTNKYSHKHVLWTAQFFDDVKVHLKNMFGLNESDYDKLLRLAAAHHAPSDFQEKIIQKADHYSSGADRSQLDEAWKDAEEENDQRWDSFRRIKMRSVFEGIILSDTEQIKDDQYKHKLPLSKITLSKNYFPQLNDDSLPNYKSLWNEFVEKLQKIESKSVRTFSETLLYLLELYTSRIPSSTRHLPDVSLFDHLKTTAGFAVCLFDYLKERNDLPSPNEKPFVLIGGDLSGIQKYIYGIVARGAAKNLKGRSFYLQLLVDNIVSKVLDHPDLNLYSANVIYSSGGGFYILAPNIPQITDIIQQLENEITGLLFEKHEGDLYLALDSIPFGETELFSKNSEDIGTIWTELGKKLSRKKAQRYKNLLQNKENYSRFFEPIAIDHSAMKDAMDGKMIKGRAIPIEEGSDKMISEYNKSIIELGKRLKLADYWIQSKEPLTYFREKVFEPAGLGYYNYFVSGSDFENNREKLIQSADHVRILYFNKEDFLDQSQRGIQNIYGFTFYGGNNFPESSFYDPKTFEELSGIEFADADRKTRKSSPQFVRMGILRMDVDNLGLIFRSGFKKDKKSFSRYSSLSRSLDYFFKGYLNKIWEENPSFNKFTQIIYAGGDDLFIVGKWDILLEMAIKIREDFVEWTCGVTTLGLSGGMAVVPPKFPILKGAIYAEDYEKSAKSHSCGDSKKNAFAFVTGSLVDDNRLADLYFSMNWDKEFRHLQALKNKIRRLMESKNGLPSGFSSGIYHLMEQADFYWDDQKQVYVPRHLHFIWMIAYSFKRNSQGKSDEVEEFMMQWVKNITTNRIPGVGETRYHALQLLALAARWASLEKRSELTN